MNKLRSLKNFLPLKILIPLLAISLLSIVSFAATVSVSNPTASQTVQGIVYNVTGGFTAASNGFQVVQSTATASAQPMTWSNGGTCQTALTVGDWYYSLTLTLASSGASPSHTYTLTVTWNTGSGWTTLGTLTFTTLSSITAGQTMTFVIDTAATTFNAPAGLTITVA